MSQPEAAQEPQSAILEREKNRLIQRYMELQDIVDGYNQQVYQLVCEIETLNLRIKESLEAERREQARTAGVLGRCGPREN